MKWPRGTSARERGMSAQAGGDGMSSSGWGPPPAPPRRPWALITVAAGCILALLLAVVGGVGVLVLRETAATTAGETSTTTSADAPSPSPTTTPPTPEPPAEPFHVLRRGEDPPEDLETLWAAMADNPLTQGDLPGFSTCELPDTPVDADLEHVQELATAAASCLNRIYSSAASDRGLRWAPARVVVTKQGERPASECDWGEGEDSDRTMVCMIDATISFPLGADLGVDDVSDEDYPALVLWSIAAHFPALFMFTSTLAYYYFDLVDAEGEDSEKGQEAMRRYTSKSVCLASLAVDRLPREVRPSPDLRSALEDPATWDPNRSSTVLAPESRARWISKGFGGEGKLSTCNSWSAPAEQVA